MVEQNNNNNTGWKITLSLEKKQAVSLIVCFFIKENSPLSGPGNLSLILVYNEKIMPLILSTVMETAV